jgi:hypothetical protein
VPCKAGGGSTGGGRAAAVAALAATPLLLSHSWRLFEDIAICANCKLPASALLFAQMRLAVACGVS